MRNRRRGFELHMLRTTAVCAVLTIVLLAVGSSLLGQGPAVRPAGKITALIPQDFINRGRDHLEAAKDASVLWNDEVETARGGRVRISLQDGSVLNIGSQTKMRIVQHDEISQQSSISLSYGKVRASVVQLTKPESKFEIKTPQAVCGVVGTDEYLDSTPASTTVLSLGGKVIVGSSDPKIPGTVVLDSFQMTVVATGRPPTPPTTASASVVSDAVHETAAVPVAKLSISEGTQGDTVQTSLEGQHLLPITGLNISGAGVTVTQGTGATDTHLPLTIVIASDAQPGTRIITLRTPSGEVAATFLIRERAGAAPSFTLIPTPITDQSRPLALGIAGNPATLVVAVLGVNQFAGSVTLTAENLPPGLALTPSTTTVAAGTGVSLQFVASPQASAGAVSFNLIGTSGTLRVSQPVYLTLVAAPAAVIGGQWWYRPDAPPQPVTPPSVSVTRGARILLDGSGSTAPGSTLSSYSWTVEGQPQQSSAATFDIDTTRLSPGTYRATLRVTNALGSTARTDLQISVRGLPNAADVLSNLRSAYESLQVSQFMSYFDPNFRGAGALEENMRNFLQTVNSLRVYLRIDNSPTGAGDDANFQATFQITFTTKDSPNVSQQRNESLTVRMHLFRDAATERWLITDYATTVSTVVVGQGTASGSSIVAPQSSTPSSSSPDLVVSSFTLSGSNTLIVGVPFTVSAVVTNQGSAAASQVVVAYRLGTQELGRSTSGALDPGQSVTLSPPPFQPGTTTGDFVLSAVVNPDQAINESNTTNNSSQPISVSVATQGVTIDATGATSQTVLRGQTTQFTFRVAVQGSPGASVALSLGAALPAGVLAQFSPPSVTGTQNVTLSVSTTQDVTLGNYSIIVVAGTARVQVTLVVQDFTLTLAPSTLPVLLGSSAAYTLTATSFNGFNQAVSLSLNQASLSPGVQVSFSSSSITPSSAGATVTVTFQTSSNTPVADSTITVSGGLGGTLLRSASAVLRVQAFSLTATPAEQAVVPGQSTSFTLQIQPQNSYASTVTLSVSGLPTGASAQFSQTSVLPPAGGVSATLTVNAAATVAVGSYPLIITASGGLVRTANVQLIVGVPFGLALSPSQISVAAGASANYTATVTPIGTFSSSVALSVSGAPAATTVTVNPQSVVPTAAGATATVTLATSGSTPPGTYQLTLTGASGTIQQTATFSLTVTPPTFQLSVSPTSASVDAGQTANFTLTLTQVGAFTSSIALSASGLPSGATANFTPASVTLTSTGATVQLAISTAPTTLPGTSSITITATGGGITQTTNVTLSVISVGSFTLAASAGGSGTPPIPLPIGLTTPASVSISVLPSGGFSGSVALSVGTLPTGITVTPTSAVIGVTQNASFTITADASASIGTAQITFSGVSGALTASVTVSVDVSNFSLSSAPANSSTTPITLIRGGASVAVAINVVANGNFTGSVTIVPTGVPAGVTVTPSSASASGGGSVTFNFTASLLAASGATTISFNGTFGSNSQVITVFLNVIGGTFTLQTQPTTSSTSPLQIARGTSSLLQVLIVPDVGFSGSVTLTVGTLPSGVEANPFTAGVNVTTITQVNFQFFASGSAPTGAFTATISAAASNGFSTSITLNLAVIGGFTLFTTPSTNSFSPLTLNPGSTTGTTLTVIVSAPTTFTSPVAVSIGPLPGGVTVNPSASSITPSIGSGSATFTLFASANVIPQSFQFTITGTSGSTIERILVFATITQPTGFALVVSSFSGGAPSNPVIVVEESTTTATVFVQPIGGFTGTVQLTLGPLPAGVIMSPTTAVSAAGRSVAFTLSARSNTQFGSAQVTITGSDGTNTNRVTMYLFLLVPPIQVTSSPPEDSLITLAPGGSATVSVTLTSQNGFSGTLDIVPITFVSGLTVTPARTTVNLTPGGSTTVSFTITASSSLSIPVTSPARIFFDGFFTLPTGNSLALSTVFGGSLRLSVAVGAPDVSLSNLTSATAPLIITAPGVGTRVTVGTQSLFGFAGTVTLTLSNVPAGISANPTTSSVSLTAGGSADTVFSFSPTTSAPLGSFQITVTATGTGLATPRTTVIFLQVTNGGYTVAASPATSQTSPLSIAAGQSATVTLTVTPVNGFTGNVFLTWSNRPSDLTITNISQSVSITGTSPVTASFTFTAAATTVTVSVINLTLSATSQAVGASQALNYFVTLGAPNFQITGNSALTIRAGGDPGTEVLTLTPLNGFTGAVSVGNFTIPSGVSITPGTTTVQLSGGPQQVSFTLTASSSATLGTSSVLFNAVSGSLFHQFGFNLTVAAGTFDIATSTSFAQPLVLGVPGSGTVTVTVTPNNGFVGTVNLVVDTTTIPSGFTISPLTQSVALSGSPVTATFSISTTAATTNVVEIGLAGTSAGLLRTTTIFASAGAPTFNLFVTPTSISLFPGGDGAFVAAVIEPLNNFASSVTITIGMTSAPPCVGVNPTSSTLNLAIQNKFTFHFFMTDPCASPGATGTVTITASGGSVTQTQTLSVTINPATFTLTLTNPTTNSPSAPLQIATTGTTTATLTLASVNGFVGTVNLSADGGPTGYTVSVSPSSVALTSGGSATITLTYTAVSTPIPGQQGQTRVKARSSSLPVSADANVLLVVGSIPGLFFTISPSGGNSNPVVIPQGGSGTFTFTMTPLNGFGSSGPVNVTLGISPSAPLPSGLTAIFSQNPVPVGTSPVSVTLTIAASSTANTNGPFTTGISVTISGFSTPNVISFTIETGTANFDFIEFTDTPTAPLVLVRGGAGQFAGVQVNPLNGFTGNIVLSVLNVPAGIEVNPSTSTMTFPGNIQLAFFFVQATSSATVCTAPNTGCTFTIQAQATIGSATVTKTVTVNLSVTDQSFTVVVSPSTSPTSPLFVPSPGTGTFTVTVGSVSSFTGSVTISVSAANTPAGTSVSPTSAIVSVTPTTPGSATFTINASTCSGSCTGTIQITATSGGLSASAQLSLVLGAQRFTLVSSTSASQPATVVQSATPVPTTVSVTLEPLNGFSGNVTLSVGTLPGGVSVSPSSQFVLLGSSPVAVNFAVTAGTSAAAGPTSFTITAASGTITGSTTVFLNITNQTFTLAVSPGSIPSAPLVLAPGASGGFTVTVTPQNGFTGSVTLFVDVNSLPTGVSVSPPSVTVVVSSASPVTTPTFTLTASSTASTTGTVAVGFFGASPQGQSVLGALFLSVGNPSFVLSGSPQNQPGPGLTLAPGSSGSFRLFVNPLNNFAGTVTVSVSGLPTGVSVTPASANAALSGSSPASLDFSFTASATASGGSSTISFTASATGVSTQTFTFTLTVTGAFTLSVSAPLGSSSVLLIVPGNSVNVTLTLTPQTGFTGTVNITVGGLVTGLTASPTSTAISLSTAAVSVPITLTASSTANLSTTVTFSGTATLTGGASFTATASLSVTSGPADFAIFTSGGSSTRPIALSPGVVRSLDVFLSPIRGFNQSVSISFSGLPTGITVNPSTATLSTSNNFDTFFNVLADATAAQGPASFTVLATSGSISHTATVFIFVSSGTFFLTSATGSTFNLLSASLGQSLTVSLNVTPSNGFLGTVTVTASTTSVVFIGSPAGVFATVTNPTQTVTVTGTSPVPVSFNVVAPNQAGIYAVIFTATSPNLPGFSATFFLELSVGQGGFTLVALDGLSGTVLSIAPAFLGSSSASLVVPANNSTVNLDVHVVSTANFSGTVVLSVTSVPTGVTLSPTTASVTLSGGSGATVRFAVTAATTATLGSFVIGLSGTSGTTAINLSVPVQIVSAPSFVLGSSPATSQTAPLFLQPSGTLVTAVAVIVQPLNSFIGSVSLSITSTLPTGVSATLTPTTVDIPDALAHTASLLLTAASGTASFGPTAVTITGTSGTTQSTVSVYIALQQTAAVRVGDTVSVSPIVQAIQPRGSAPGTHVRVRVVGQHLGAISRVVTEQGFQTVFHPASTPTELWIDLDVDASVTLGVHSLLFVSPQGTFVVPFVVQDSESIASRRLARKGLDAEQESGRVEGPGAVRGMRKGGAIGDSDASLPRGSFAGATGRPRIMSIQPAQIDPGDDREIRIYGTALEGATAVRLGDDAEVRILARTPELLVSIRISDDAVPGAHLIRVETPDGFATGTLTIRGAGKVINSAARRSPNFGGGDMAADPSRGSLASKTPAGARLVVTPADVSISPSFPKRGDTIRFMVQVRNDGDSEAEDTVVALLIPEVSVQARESVSLGPGRSVTIEFDWNSAQAQGLVGSPRLHPRIVLDADHHLASMASARREVQLGELRLEDGVLGAGGSVQSVARSAFVDRGTVELSLGGCRGLRLTSASQAGCGEFAEVEFSLSNDGTQLLVSADGVRALAASTFDNVSNVDLTGMGTRQAVEMGRVYAVEARGKLYLVRVDRIQGLREALAQRLPPPLDTPQLNDGGGRPGKLSARTRREPPVNVELQWTAR